MINYLVGKYPVIECLIIIEAVGFVIVFILEYIEEKNTTVTADKMRDSLLHYYQANREIKAHLSEQGLKDIEEIERKNPVPGVAKR